MSPSILFILKKKQIYDTHTYSKNIQSGLINSASFINHMLNENGVKSHLVQVIDNNDIDREVTKHKPTDVIIEAIWVVPEKFRILAKLHPNVHWIIRIHSEIPFISEEGNALSWINGYSNLADEGLNISIAPNTIKMYEDLKVIGVKHLVMLPNYYPETKHEFVSKPSKDHIDIGCFGAIRPMKNQLIQAVAAIRFGNAMGKKIKFHINATRVEKGNNALKNIQALFESQGVHELVEHPWYSHKEFLHVVSHMDLGMQVSFNETFNIVAADFVSHNVPLIASKEIDWLHPLYKCGTTSTKDIAFTLLIAYAFRNFNLQTLNKRRLIKFSASSRLRWLEYFSYC
jgi:hypothetical protein